MQYDLIIIRWGLLFEPPCRPVKSLSPSAECVSAGVDERVCYKNNKKHIYKRVVIEIDINQTVRANSKFQLVRAAIGKIRFQTVTGQK